MRGAVPRAVLRRGEAVEIAVDQRALSAGSESTMKCCSLGARCFVSNGPIDLKRLAGTIRERHKDWNAAPVEQGGIVSKRLETRDVVGRSRTNIESHWNAATSNLERKIDR